MTPAPHRQGILFAAAGSSSPGAREVFDRIGQAALKRFPGIDVRWAFTSSGVRRKLAQQGRSVHAPREALAAMQAEGFTHVAVPSLHLSDGMEYGELAETVASFREGTGTLRRLALGPALMADEPGWRQVLRTLLSSLPARQPDEGVVLVAHGSLDPRAVKTFARAIGVCRQVDPALFLGMILGEPSQEQIGSACRAAGIRKVWLLPCMVAAGYSAQADITGAGQGSWKSGLERAGLQCVPVLRGLGDYAGVIDVWLGQCRGLLSALSENKGTGE